MADFTAYSPQGPTVYLARKWDTRFLPLEWQWFRLQNQGVYFKFDQIELTNAMEWRFIYLNRSYARLNNQLETVLVYTDAVQFNTINRQVPLLRSLHLTRGGQGRVTVEPLHRE